MKQKIAFAMVMGCITTGLISFALLSINIGFAERFLQKWATSWLIAYLLAVPVIIFIGPRVQQMISLVLKEKNTPNEN